MPHVKFGAKDEPGFDLVESPDLVAVRTHSHQSVRGRGPVPQPTAAEVSDGKLLASFPEVGVEVYQIPATHRSLRDRKQTLRASPDVRFAGSVLVHPETNEPVLYTENLYIRFREDMDPDDCESVIREAGLAVKERLNFAGNAFFTEAPEGTGQRVFDIALELLSRDDVVYCHPELIGERGRKEVFPEQWHLKTTTLNGVPINAHVSAEGAHTITRGAGVTIAVIDDGVDVDHPEFGGAGKIVAPRDATSRTNDPRPKWSNDNHGTACAGVACANGVEGASGVAPLAKLMPIRLASGLGSIREAEAFHWAADNGADVISCSWGPPDGRWWDPDDPRHSRPVALPASTKEAIDYAVTNGRGGKGCVVLFAAGNGNEPVENDGYASYEKVIAVAACNDQSRRSVYSDIGDSIWCAFPSSDFGHIPFGHPEPLTSGIWTTDRTGAAGYNPGDLRYGDAAGNLTNDFGGTSSACPGAAGVAALVLSANPALRWDEVRKILRRACDRIDPQGGQYDAESHSKLYGYGRLNAETAVKLARESIRKLTVVSRVLNEPIPDLGTVEGTLEVTETAAVEKVAAYVQIEHTYIGDLRITLVPPADSGLPKVVLHNRAGGWRNDIDMVYDPSNTPAMSAYAGKKCNGTWIVRVEDKAALDSGTLVQIGLHLFAPSIAPVRASAARSRPRRTIVRKDNKSRKRVPKARARR